MNSRFLKSALAGSLALAGLAATLPAAAVTYAYKVQAYGLHPEVKPPMSCALPWGGTLESGGQLSAYSVPRAETSCAAYTEVLSCSDGKLSDPAASQTCTPYDALFSGVSLLMHMDNNVTDVKGSAVVNQGLAFSSAVSKFGGYSAYAPAGGNRARVPSASMVSGTQDFTIEGWVYPTAYPGNYGQLITSTSTGGFATSITSTGKIWVGRALMAGVMETTGTVPRNQWSHVAYVRSGSNFKVFINGAVAGNFTLGFSDWGSGDAFLFVDGNGSTFPLQNVYLDDLRISKGVVRYTGAFQVPTAPFPNE